MKRPIGVMLLALGAGVAGLYQLWRAAVFMGWVNWTFGGNDVSFKNPQWGQVILALMLAAIWFYVAIGFWNVRGYAWSFGTFIAIFTMVFSFFALLSGTSAESELVALVLSTVIFFYLNYPGVREHFVQNEMARLTPEQREAMEKLAAANAAAAAAMAKPGSTPPGTGTTAG